jgi:signal transduction histidine kinase
LDNVLRNALKHTPAGTQIWIRTRTPASIIIEDGGPGVPAHLHERVFEPFQQGPDQLDRDAPGTGIGLSLSQRVVRLRRGEITLSDRPGGGARFVVDLSEASG